MNETVWDVVSYGNDFAVARMEVPGGWLYRSRFRSGSGHTMIDHVTFVPAPSEMLVELTEREKHLLRHVVTVVSEDAIQYEQPEIHSEYRAITAWRNMKRIPWATSWTLKVYPDDDNDNLWFRLDFPIA